MLCMPAGFDANFAPRRAQSDYVPAFRHASRVISLTRGGMPTTGLLYLAFQAFQMDDKPIVRRLSPLTRLLPLAGQFPIARVL